LALLVNIRPYGINPLGSCFFSSEGRPGSTLIAAKKRNHIGPPKNKQRLVNAQQKTAGNELAAGPAVMILP
jgi:hypothetical protein